MAIMKQEYIEKIYAGWLAKVIGVRLGAPIEGWTYNRIQDVFGELNSYPADYKQFAADDDTNGPIFFVRALEDGKNGTDITAQDVGEALLNYACFEKGFFWWGGYGVSTEHTAYLNLRNGIQAPKSGSIAHNGSTVAEQIGGQIFIDSWGLVTPGNPDLAAHYARLAASVTHDGNGIFGGIFIAVCVSYAFVENNIRKIIEKGLSYIPEDCEYARVVGAVMEYHDAHPENWRDCFGYIYENFGYDKYPGNCHIIPNAAVMILSLVYGKGDFEDTLNICNMCGWDTDCNVGNIATIMGVYCGLEKIDYAKWRKCINDILICSSVMGSLNIMDIPENADYMVRLAAKIAGWELPKPWQEIIERKQRGCHFEYPGSTQGMRVRQEGSVSAKVFLVNTEEVAFTGKRCLKVHISGMAEGKAYLYKKTYYVPEDFNDSRYDPSFSPIVYAGQRVSGYLRLTAEADSCVARAYVHNRISGEILQSSDGVILSSEEWKKVTFQIPYTEDGIFDEAGFSLVLASGNTPAFSTIEVLLDDFYIEGIPDYAVNFANTDVEFWNVLRREIAQFTKLKGLTFLENSRLHISCGDFGETYTGSYDWEDYRADFWLRPETGTWHTVNVRVQGAIRSYAAGFTAPGKAAFLKNDNGYQVLAETEYVWEHGKEYHISVRAQGNHFQISVEGKVLFTVTDEEHPYLRGTVGMSVQNGSHSSYGRMEVRRMD